MIFKLDHIHIGQNFATKDALFTFLAKQAVSKNIATSEQLVKDAFVKREAEGTTGFEEGFAIPHARVMGIDKPAIFVIRNEEKISDWAALDHQGVRYIIALMIPEQASNLHMDVLSTIAAKLLDNDFKNKIKHDDQVQIFQEFKDIIKSIEIKQNHSPVEDLVSGNTDAKELIIGISACPAGIAHTFMAKQKMQDGAKKLNMDIKWETQGANGQKTPLTKADIDKASVIIIASDIDLDLSRFVNHKILLTNTNDAIKNGAQLITRAKKEAQKYTGVNIVNKTPLWSFFSLLRKSFQSSFGSPWVYLSLTGVMLALFTLIGNSLYGALWTTDGNNQNHVLFQLQEIAKFALYLSMPYMAGSVAKKATNKNEAFVIAFMATLLINIPTFMSGWNWINDGQQQVINIFYDWNNFFTNQDLIHGSNILGAIIVTLLTIFIIKIIFHIRKYLSVNQKWVFARVINAGYSPWITILFSMLIVMGAVVFLFGAPLSFASAKMTYALVDYAHNYWWLRLLIGGFFGLLIASDLGGIINKVSLIVLIGLAQYDLKFAALISTGIPAASIGYGTSYALFKHKYQPDDAKDARHSFRKGLNGMTEGPLFLTNKYKWRVIVPNLMATFIATGLTLMIGLYIFKGGHIGILFFGAQADLSHANDLAWLDTLLPKGQGLLTAFSSIAYGIIGYYLVMLIAAFAYALISYVTFSWPGKNRIFLKSGA